MHQNTAVRTRRSEPVRQPAESRAPLPVSSATSPPAVALLAGPALLAVCFR
jgi:hypothetical protein